MTFFSGNAEREKFVGPTRAPCCRFSFFTFFKKMRKKADKQEQTFDNVVQLSANFMQIKLMQEQENSKPSHSFKILFSREMILVN